MFLYTFITFQDKTPFTNTLSSLPIRSAWTFNTINTIIFVKSWFTSTSTSRCENFIFSAIRNAFFSLIIPFQAKVTNTRIFSNLPMAIIRAVFNAMVSIVFGKSSAANTSTLRVYLILSAITMAVIRFLVSWGVLWGIFLSMFVCRSAFFWVNYFTSVWFGIINFTVLAHTGINFAAKSAVFRTSAANIMEFDITEFALAFSFNLDLMFATFYFKISIYLAKLEQQQEQHRQQS